MWSPCEIIIDDKTNKSVGGKVAVATSSISFIFETFHYCSESAAGSTLQHDILPIFSPWVKLFLRLHTHTH